MRISRIPGENTAQYRRNLARDAASVASTRVSVRSIDAPGPIESAAMVTTIFTKPAESKEANAFAGSARKITLGFHGCVTAPNTIRRPGMSASTPQPIDVSSATMGSVFGRAGGVAPRISSRARKIACTTAECCRSIERAAAFATDAGAATRVRCTSATS